MVKSDALPLYEEKGRFIFWSYYFKVFQNRIEAYFSPHKQVIPFSEIESVELVEKIPWPIGRGLRYGSSWTKYFVTRGEGIGLRMKRGRWKKIVLSVEEPKRVKSLIEERLEPPEPETGLEGISQGE